MNFYLIKASGIAYIILLYFLYIILSIKFLNYIFDYNNIKDYTLHKSIILFLLRLWLIGVLYYIARNLLIYIPFPLDNFCGYKHDKLKEVNSGLFTLPLFGLLDANLRLLANNINIYI